jgi:7-carboxy-7-deazaguanine synthase
VKIAELFLSRQGEGLLTGQRSIFVRASGCNLRCWFCDTRYASWEPEGEELSVGEIIGRISAFDSRYVVITGGEPMLFADLVDLTAQLRAGGYHITIETAGTCYLPVSCDLMSLSPKFASSAPAAVEHPTWYARHEARRHVPNVVRRLIDEFNYQVKFVVDTPDDLADVERYLAEFPHISRRRVLLMPQGIEPQELQAKAGWLQEFCRAHGLRYCPRKQIEWFGLVRGT